MTGKRSGLLAVTLLWANLAYAAEGRGEVSAAPAPLFKDPITGMQLVLVKGGCYPMGDIYDDGVSGSGESTDEKPVHEVCVNDFYIGKYEVTQGQWKAVMGSNPTTAVICREDNCPVGNVSWNDAQEFISRLNGRSGGSRYRLPTEAEWEYAARSGGKSERYSGGNDVESVSWYDITTGYSMDGEIPFLGHPVGARLPNGLGLHDMSGNVYELTSDWYGSTYYASSPRDNPTGPATGTEHVKRGGCAHGHPGNGRTSRRLAGDGPDDLIGFRLLRMP